MPSAKEGQVAGPDVTVIVAKLLIPGRGDPVENAAVAVEDGKIAHVGKHDKLPNKYRSVRPVHVPVVMPGLWDVHTHFVGLDVVTSFDTSLFSVLPGSNALVGAITVENLKETLMAGYTSIESLADMPGIWFPSSKRGAWWGPTYLPEGGVPCCIVDGVDDCAKAVRLLVRRRARCIKVCSSGGALRLLDDPEDRQFSDGELKAIVEGAGRSRRAVAAHAIGEAGIMAALRAGVKSIEHGMYLDDEVADGHAGEGRHLRPHSAHRDHHRQRSITATAPIAHNTEKLMQKAKDSYQLAIKGGIKIALGTDSVSGDRTKGLAYGNNAMELYWAVKNGMTPLQAIEAATANGQEVLGWMALLSGQLKEGYNADLIAVAKSPLDVIEVMWLYFEISAFENMRGTVSAPTQRPIRPPKTFYRRLVTCFRRARWKQVWSISIGGLALTIPSGRVRHALVYSNLGYGVPDSPGAANKKLATLIVHTLLVKRSRVHDLMRGVLTMQCAFRKMAK
ncbi:hypothetical protein LZ30DRAFT_766360 [Colletotrichum cereale]|nr:hypothetical protein LZ30DRAFT_766360 [Colletotrichum cereale]